MVTVEIGEEHHVYHAYKALLIHHSDYFRKALKGPWKESKEHKVTLEDIEPNTFDIFVIWLYTQRLPGIISRWEEASRFRGDGNNEDEDGGEYETNNTPESHLEIIKALVLGDRILAAKFRQAVNNYFVDRVIESPPYYESVIYAFERLRSDSPILPLLADTHCEHWTREEDKDKERELRSLLPVDFLIRVMGRYSDMKHSPTKKFNS